LVGKGAVKGLSNDHIDTQGFQEVEAFLGRGQIFEIFFAPQHDRRVGKKSKHNRGRSCLMSSCNERTQYLLVTEMDSVKDANG
jgi:hypothetical protein